MMANAAAKYEEKYSTLKIEGANGVSALRFLVNSHKIRQRDLPEIGSQGVVSEVLNGRRKLTLRHIRGLAGRFKVCPSVFIESE